MTTDEEAEVFLDSDLSDLDFTQFKPARFAFTKKQAASSRRMRLSPGARAPKSGIYQQTGPRGGRPGKRIRAIGGTQLPPAPAGRKWTLLEPSRDS
jgi:hypothetical protein